MAKCELRGSDKVMVLIDGKQTALTGFGSQNGLDNLPASALERIEVITNPSAKFDANASAGIINLVFKKQEQEGFNGKLGMMAGAGALWVKKENLPTIRPQYQRTPKLNPSLSVNYRKGATNSLRAGRLAPFADAEQERVLDPHVRRRHGHRPADQAQPEHRLRHDERRRRPRLR